MKPASMPMFTPNLTGPRSRESKDQPCCNAWPSAESVAAGCTSITPAATPRRDPIARAKFQAPFKENTKDFVYILRVMERAKYNGYFSLEYVWSEWMRCNKVDNLSATILMPDLFRSQDATAWRK